MAYPITAPFQQFWDRNGDPLQNGYIYIGTANLDAQANPITVYWDAAATIPASQPIRTLNGYPVWNGTAANIYVAATDCSIKILDSKGTLVVSKPTCRDQEFVNNMIFVQSGTGAVSQTVQAKLRRTVDVLDYGADPTGVTDSTTAFTNAQGSGNVLVNIPPGTYLLNNLRIKNGVVLRGSGTNSTILKQYATGNYAINMLSDASVGQLLGCQITDVQLQGKTSATVAALNMEANGVYAIRDAIINVTAYDTYAPLRMNCPTAGAIYTSHITIQSDKSVVSMETQGSYNVYDIFTTRCNAAIAVNDISGGSTFLKVISEAGQVFQGQHNTIINATVENWSGSTAAPGSNIAINNAGYNNTLINATITTVPSASCNYGFKNNATPGTWINPRIIGTNIVSTPTYGMNLAAGSSGLIVGATFDCTTKIEAYTAGSTMQKWTLAGDCSTMTAAPNYRASQNYVKSAPISGATITFLDNQNAFLIQPAALLATLTVVMPPAPLDGQMVSVSASSFGITALTVSPNAGQSIVSAPTTLAAGASFRMIYSVATTTWYPI